MSPTTFTCTSPSSEQVYRKRLQDFLDLLLEDEEEEEENDKEDRVDDGDDEDDDDGLVGDREDST